MRVSAAWRIIGVAVLGGAIVACGISVAATGSREAPEEDAGNGDPRDGAAPLDGGRDGEGPTADADAGCVPVVIDDPLTIISPIRWLLTSSQADYPQSADPGTGTMMAAINASMQPSQRAGLWLRDPVPTTAFDVTFDYIVVCDDDEPCADGVAAAWLDTGDAGVLATGNPGKELAIPKVSGGAVAIKVDVKLSKPDPKEDTFPTLIVHDMDAGTSDNTPTKMVRADTLVGALRRVKLRLRKGQLTVVNTDDAGAAISIVGPTRSGFLGYFGFTASTGLHYDAAYVGSFHGEFYACEP